MTKWAYYNEINKEDCEWLRELMRRGHITEGEIDERSITEVRADDVRGFRRRHWFAGVGGWELALNLADWPDDQPVDSASCPCQPFSCAGEGGGELDLRHLWPELHRIRRELEPRLTFGEQVASPLGIEWIDGVSLDLEELGYAVGAFDLPAASVGAPHIRQRLYWVADPDLGIGEQRCQDNGGSDCRSGATTRAGPGGSGVVVGLADSNNSQCSGVTDRKRREPNGETARRIESNGVAQLDRAVVRLGHPHDPRLQRRRLRFNRDARPWTAWPAEPSFLACADGKSRRVESGIFPLAHGIPSRVGPMLAALRPLGKGAVKAARTNRIARLHAYGNAIVPELAAQFIGAWRDDHGDRMGGLAPLEITWAD